MPMYEYHCPRCGARFERIVSFTQADQVDCPECGTVKAQRKVSKVALRTAEGSSSAAACAPSGGA